MKSSDWIVLVLGLVASLTSIGGAMLAANSAKNARATERETARLQFLEQRLSQRKNDVYQELVFKNRERLPLPNECDFATDEMWTSMKWFYSHSYFTRVWVIQELNARKERVQKNSAV